MSEWTLYILRCRNGQLYTGITTDLTKRLTEHTSDKGRGAKYLRGKQPLTLVFQMTIGEKPLACRVEYRIKRLSKQRKIFITNHLGHLTELLTYLKLTPSTPK